VLRIALARDSPPWWRVRARPWNPGETDELASGTQKAENNRYRRQTLESVKHHLKPNRQRSVGPRQYGDIRGHTAARTHGTHAQGTHRAGIK